MAFTLLLIGGAIAASAVFVATTRSAVQAALAGQNTAVGLTDPAAETAVGGGAARSPARTDWQLTTVTDLRAAEDLLDSLENRGIEERELVALGNSAFAVRWR